MIFNHEEIKRTLEPILYVSPPKTLFEKEWIIALISSMAGFLFGLLSQLFIDWIKQKKLVKSIVISVFDEVFENWAQTGNKNVLAIKDVRREFLEITSHESRPNIGPSLAYFDISHIEYYDIYCKDFYLLRPRLREPLTHFYVLLKSISANSKKLDDLFNGYYKMTGIAGSTDIIKFVDKLILQIESAYRTGTQVLAIIMKDYKYTGRLPTVSNDSEIYVKNKINQYLEERMSGEKVTVSDISKHTAVADLLIAKSILDDARFKEHPYGIFELVI